MGDTFAEMPSRAEFGAAFGSVAKSGVVRMRYPIRGDFTEDMLWKYCFRLAYSDCPRENESNSKIMRWLGFEWDYESERLVLNSDLARGR